MPLSSSLLVELGYICDNVSRVQKERHEDIAVFYLKNHCACASGGTVTKILVRVILVRADQTI